MLAPGRAGKLRHPGNARAKGTPEVCRPEDGVWAVEDPAAPAGALWVVGGVDDHHAGQQAAQDERQQYAVAPRARVAQIHHVPPGLSLGKQAGRQSAY